MSRNHTPKAAELLAGLAQFTGDLDRYRHPLCRNLLYTPGVQYLAEQAGAYWLIDAIASYIPSQPMRKAIERDSRIGQLHFWKLTVQVDASAVLAARVDDGVRPFITQEIPYTDFPLDEIDLWLASDGTYWTLYLPSEH